MDDDIYKIPIVEIAAKLGLKGSGKAWHCFNKGGHKNGDANPSLVLYPHSFKCMACGVSGNSIELAKRVLNYSPKDAIKWIENNFSMGANIYPIHNANDDKKVSKQDIEIYGKLFELAGHIDDRHWKYLKGRGLLKLALKYGISNVKADTEKHLRDSFSMHDLLHSGVFSLGKYQKPYFAFYKHTLLFPFFHKDDIVFIQGRTIEHMNWKYNLLKGKKIPYPYNVNVLLNPDISGEDVLICEGCIDTLSLLVNGYNAIGIIGAKNFKPEWVNLFDKYKAMPVVAFDKDTVGNEGAMDVVNKFKRDLNRYSPKNGKDWNDAIN